MNADTPPVTGTFLNALARKECKTIAKAMGNTKDRHRGIHEARKAIRRLRSLLSLVTGAVGHDTAKIDLALQKQAKRLCALRDSHVVVTMAEKLAADDASGEWAIAAQVLAVQRDLLLEVELSKDPGFARRIAAIGDIAAVFDKLRWKRLSQEALQRAIKKSHRRVTRAEHEAADTGTPASLHRWRRRVRRLRMQLDAVQALNKLAGVRIKRRMHTKTSRPRSWPNWPISSGGSRIFRCYALHSGRFPTRPSWPACASGSESKSN